MNEERKRRENPSLEEPYHILERTDNLYSDQEPWLKPPRPSVILGKFVNYMASVSSSEKMCMIIEPMP